MSVFISYSSKDKTLLDNSLVLALDAKGVPYWHDRGIDNGEDIPHKLRQMIQECEVCILLATSNSLASEWCKMEIAAFWSAGKRVIIFSADGSITSDMLPPYMRNFNYNGSLLDIVETARNQLSKQN
jgi:TIR domain